MKNNPTDSNESTKEQSGGIFNLSHSYARASVVYLPVPWDATTVRQAGMALAPQSILAASKKINLFDTDILKPSEAGLYLEPISEDVQMWNETARANAQNIIEVNGNLENNEVLPKILSEVNRAGDHLNAWVRKESERIMGDGKILALMGGDHSISLGALQAVGEMNSLFGILHFCARPNLQSGPLGFHWSHESVMYNVLERIPQMAKLVQVGVKEISDEEYEYTRAAASRLKVFSDRDLSFRKFRGESWMSIADSIVDQLPRSVWISFGMSALDPRFSAYAPGAAPGGLDFNEASFILREIVKSGRKIVGFDLSEMATHSPSHNDEWSGAVGARLLYKLTGWTLASQGKAQIIP